MRVIHFAISIALLLMVVSVSLAEDVSISSSVDRSTVSVGDVIDYTIYVQSVQSTSVPKLPKLDGFQSQYVRSTTKRIAANGRSMIYVEHQYYLKATKVGRFTIPAMGIRYADKLHQTSPIHIQVKPKSGSAQSDTMTAEDMKKYIRLSVITRKDTAYINEGIPLLIRLYVRSGIQVENLSRRPRFLSTGFSMIPFGNPVQRQTTINGILFTTVDFSTTVYPVKSGKLTLGPAELDCRVLARPSSTSYRRRRYEITRKSEPLIITVKPLPTAGQPGNFSGVVGQFKLDVEAKPLELKAGEPITLTMTVRGDGNIDAAKIPEISDLTYFKVYNPQIDVKQKGNAGIKTFEQVLIPTSADAKVIPEIRFSYFDPEKEQYETETKGPIRIQVIPSDEEETLQALRTAEKLGRGIAYIKDEMGVTTNGDGRLYKNKGFLLLHLLPLAGFIGALTYQRRRERFATDRPYARQYHAPRKAKKGLAQAQELITSGQPQEFCSTIFKTMQEYLGDRFNLPSAGITIEIVNSMRGQGFTEEILENLTAFFHTCDRTRFTGSEVDKNEMTQILGLAKENIRLLETIGTSEKS